MDKEYKDSIKKQEKAFDAMKDFIDSQFNPNGHINCDFAPDIILYMMDKIQETAKNYISASEAQEDDDLNMEIQQWNNINKALSKADKVKESLENEKKLRGEK